MKSANKTKNLALALLLFAVFALTPAATAYGEAQIWTDQEDYAPWEIVTIMGAGFEPSTEDNPIDVSVTITWPDGYVDGPYTGTTDDLGNFLFIYGKDKFEGTYTVVAEDSTGIRATATFTDSTVDVAAVDVTAPAGSVTLAPGSSGPITINMTVTGKQEGTATFKVYRDWTLSGGTFTGSNFQTFTVNPRAATDSPTTFSTSGTVTVAAGHSTGTFTLAVSAFDITNSNTTGAKLSDGADSNYQVTVSAPPPPSDTTPPVIIPNVVGTLGSNGWYVSDVTVSWSVSDPESDIASSTGAGTTTLTTDTAGTTLTCSATNGAGLSNSVSVTIKIDKTGPAVIASASPAPNANGWNNTDVTVTFSATDAGSGMASTDPPVTVTTEGDGQVIIGYATDLAGNVGSASITLNIDKTPPTIAATAKTADDNPYTAGAWTNQNVIVQYTASDALSDIDEPASDLSDDVVAAEGAGQSASGTAVDLAGNTATATFAPINIDKTPPTFGDCPVGGPFLLNSGLQPVGPISVDALISGLNAGASTLTGLVDTSSVGSKTVTFTAVDNAGNTATKECTYIVVYDFGGFLPPVTLDGRSLLKLGSTIPVKFQLFDAAGSPVSTAVATIRVVKISSGSPVGTEVDGVSTSAATTGNLFRYDSTGQLYIFNLATKPLPAPADGTWRITVYLNDGTSQTVDIGIKK